MTVEAWAADEVRNLLARAADGGRTMTLPEMREEAGVGHDDLGEVLDRLREQGYAVEASPGEWRGPLMDEMPGRDVPARTSPAASDDGPSGDRAAPTSRIGVLARTSPGDPTVRLTFGVADALDEAALGQLVKAGIEEAKVAQSPFTLEVS